MAISTLGNEARREWLAFACGIVFVGMLVISNLLPTQPPQSSDSADMIIAFFRIHRFVFLLALYLQGLSIAPLFIFAAKLRNVLHRAEGGTGFFAGISFAASVATGALALAIGPFWAVLAYNQTTFDGNPAVVHALFDLGNVGYNLISFPSALFVATASFVMIRTGVMARWLGWVGLLVALSQLISAGSLAQNGVFAPGGVIILIGFLLFVLWIFATSILFLFPSRTTPHIAMHRSGEISTEA